MIKEESLLNMVIENATTTYDNDEYKLTILLE